MDLSARIHRAKESGLLHLRVRQAGNDGRGDEVKAAMERVGSPARWDQATWEWDYPLTPAALTALHEVATRFGATLTWDDALRALAEYHVQLEAYEEQVRRWIEGAIRNPGQVALEPYPTNEPAPFWHQAVSYHWALRSSGVFLAHDPGLGKSRSAVDAIGGWYRHGIIDPMQWDGQRMVGGVLIVCPKVMISTWIEECRQWQGLQAISVSGNKGQKLRRSITPAHAHVINYENLQYLVQMGASYHGIIVDESHRCANHSQQMLNVLHLSTQCRRKVLLSGTPVSNNLESVFYQSLICDGGKALGSSKTRFLEQFFNAVKAGPGKVVYDPRANAVTAVSNAMSRFTYFLSKEVALPNLPEKTHQPIYVEMTQEQQSYYEKMEKETLVYVQDQTVTMEMATTRMMKLIQVCQGFVIGDDGTHRDFGSAKLDALVDLLTGTYRGRKVVIWARFTSEIYRISKALTDAGLGHLLFHGNTTEKERKHALKSWDTDPNMTVFVGQLSMGIGITLHAKNSGNTCRDTIFFGIDYSYTNWIQAQDRIHRIGQDRGCTFLYLLTRGGIDHRIYRAVLAKAALAQEVHTTGRDYYLRLLRGDEVAAMDVPAA